MTRTGIHRHSTNLSFLACLSLLGSQLAHATADKATKDVELCGQFDYYNSTTTPFFFNNNAWNNNSATAQGNQCLTIVEGGKSWSVTYLWDGDNTLVKGYPYMQAHPSNMPVPLCNITSLNIAGNWNTYVVRAQNDSAEEQAQAFDDTGYRGNIAIDMFLSDDPATANSQKSPIEVMIWPWWTPTIWPLGWDQSSPDTDVVTVDGTEFGLYHGDNDDGQHVFSWLAKQNMTTTNADYSPLLQYLIQNGMLTDDLWVGSLEFGTEIMYATNETRFEASDMVLEFVRQEDSVAISTVTTTVPARTGSATATGKSTSGAQRTYSTGSLYLMLFGIFFTFS